MPFKNKLLGRKFLISLISTLFLFLFAFLIIDSYFSLDGQVKLRSAEAKDMIDQRMNSILSEMNIFPQQTENDILFLSQMSSLKSVIATGDSSDINKIKDLESDFLAFLKRSTSYYQLRYIDENGDEVVRVEFDGLTYKSVPKDQLQNKKDQYYFNETIKLSEGEIFISQLDLNVENNKLENRGTIDNPKYVPVMRAASPVFSVEGAHKGLVLFNIYTDFFLDEVRRSQREGESVFLINKEGYYLSHPDRKKEFAFLFDKKYNFYEDYPEISKELVLGLDKIRIDSNDQIFSFKHTYPTAGSDGAYSNLEKNTEISEEDYFWVLITASDKTEVNYALENLRTGYLYFLLFSGLIIVTIISLIFILVFKSHNGRLLGG